MIEPAKFEKALSQIAMELSIKQLNVWFGDHATALIEQLNISWLNRAVGAIAGNSMANWDSGIYYWKGRVPMPESSILTPFFCMVEEDKTMSIWFNDQKHVNEIMERMKVLVGTEDEPPKSINKEDLDKLFGNKNEGRFGFGSVNLN